MDLLLYFSFFQKKLNLNIDQRGVLAVEQNKQIKSIEVFLNAFAKGLAKFCQKYSVMEL